jgi:hypothetical protein
MKKTTTIRPTNHGRQGSTGGNSVYVAIAGEVVLIISKSVPQIITKSVLPGINH